MLNLPESPPNVEAHRVEPEEGCQEEEVHAERCERKGRKRIIIRLFLQFRWKRIVRIVRWEMLRLNEREFVPLHIRHAPN